MKVLVCISNVPDTTTKINFNDDKTSFNATGVQFIINPYDEIALTRALELTEAQGGSVTVINIGDPSTDATIRKALAIGATDAVRINSVPRDAFFVATQIAAYAKDQGFDLILTEAGKTIAQQVAGFPDLLQKLLNEVPETRKVQLDLLLTQLTVQLKELGILSGQRSCVACQHSIKHRSKKNYYCTLYQSKMGRAEIKLNCADFQPLSS